MRGGVFGQGEVNARGARQDASHATVDLARALLTCATTTVGNRPQLHHDIAPHGSPLGEYSICVAAASIPRFVVQTETYFLCSNGALGADSAVSMALEGRAANDS